MKYLSLISKCFKQKFNNEDLNKSLNEFIWDSLTKITLMTELNKKYKKNVDFKKLEKIKTFKELDNLIEKTIKK